MCIFEPDLCPHDYEQITSLYVHIRVDDNGQPPASQKFWIQIRIIDENDPPVNLQLDANLVKENSPIGTLIGEFSVQDEDLYQTHTFTILYETPLDTNGNFFLIEDNELRLTRSPDYEQEQFILVTIQTMDNGTIPKNVRQRIFKTKEKKKLISFRSPVFFSLKFLMLMNFLRLIFFFQILMMLYPIIQLMI